MSHGTTAGHFICTVVNGPAPSPDHEAAHSCHNAACINPDHLSWQHWRDNSVAHLPFKLGRRDAAREASKVGIEKQLLALGKDLQDRGISRGKHGWQVRIRKDGKSYTKRADTKEELRAWRDDMLTKLNVNGF